MFSWSRLIQKVGIYLAGSIFVIFLAVWAASFYLIPWQINTQLKPYQLTLESKASLSINPFILQVEIKDLVLVTEQEQKPVASIEYAVLDVSWLGLISKEINIDEFVIDTLNIKVKRSEESLNIAGIELPLTEQKSTNSEISSPEATIKENEPLDWQFVMANANFSNLVIDIDDVGHQQTFTFNNIGLSEVRADLQQQQAKVSTEALINQAPLSLKLDAEFKKTEAGNSKLALNSELSIKQLALADFAYLVQAQPNALVEKLVGFVDLSAKQTVQLIDDSWSVKQQHFSIELANVEVKALDYQLKNQLFSIQLNEGEYSGSSDASANVQAHLAIASNALSVDVYKQDNTEVGKLASLSALKVPNIMFNLAGSETPELAIEQINFHDILISEPLMDSLESEQVEDENSSHSKLSAHAIWATEQVAINGVNLKEQHLAIDDIQLSAFNSRVLLDKEKKLANLVLAESAKSADSKTEKVVENTETAQSTEQAFTFSLGKFSLIEPSKVHFTDQSVTPVFEQTLTVNTLELSKLNNQIKEQTSNFALAFKLSQYSGADVKGSITPFADKLNLTTHAKIKEFSLPSLSSYMRDALGFDFLAGQLDTDVEVTVVNDDIDGEVNIALRGFEISSDNDVSGDHVKESTAIPLNVALNMLKDSDNNLHLDIPLSGNVSDPQFGLSSFVTLIAKKAVMAQAENYLINTFVPYANIVSVARVAGEYLLKLEVEDLLYQPKQIELNEAQHNFINELVKLLTDKPEQQVRLCAYAVKADVEQSNLQEQSVLVSELQKLSTERGQALKASLVEEYNIASSRLLLCEPKVDLNERAKPRVEFTL